MNIDSRFLVNLVAFQLGWFACVWGGANQLPSLGAITVAIIVVVHLTYTAHRPGPELTLILAAAAIGVIWDSGLVALGWLSYPSGTLVAGTAPYWIVAMWISFATTLNVSLGWLKKRYLLAALFGGLGGPMAYYAGFKLGGVEFSSMTVGLAAQAAGWAVMMPLLTILAERLNGMRPAPLVLAAEERG